MSETLAPDEVDFVTDQIESAERDAVAPDSRRRHRAQAMRPVVWRLHFLGGFLATRSLEESEGRGTG